MLRFGLLMGRGISLIVIGVLLVFTERGVTIDFNEKKVKYYIGLFLIKIGKWKPIDKYQYVSLLHFNQTSAFYSLTGLGSSEREKVYRVCLLNKTHRDRLKIVDCDNKEKAMIEAENIAKNLKFDFVTYSPI